MLFLLLLFNGISVDKKQYEHENNVLIIHQEKKYTYDYSCQIIMVGQKENTKKLYRQVATSTRKDF